MQVASSGLAADPQSGADTLTGLESPAVWQAKFVQERYRLPTSAMEDDFPDL